MRHLGYLCVVVAVAALIGQSFWGCAPPPPSQTLSPEQEKAIEDSIRKAREIELAKKYSYAFENYKTARTTENPQHKEIYYRDAIRYFWEVADLDVDSKYNIYGKLSDCYTQLEKGDSAVTVLEMGVEKFPKDTYLNQSLGYIYKSRGNYETSLNYYLVALSNEPENLDFLKTVGELYKKRGDINKAIETYQKYRTINPDDRGVQEELTELIRKGRPPEEYLAELISFLQQNPDDIQKRFDLANFYYESSDNDKAIDQYNEILKRDAKNVTALEKLARAYENLRKYREAISTFDQILAIDGARKDILSLEALDFIELKDYTRARQKAQRAISLDANYGRAWVVMGKIYQSNADDCSRGRQLNYYDKLVYLVAYGLYKHGKEVGDFDSQADADRWIGYLSGSLLIPQKEDWFLNKTKTRPQGDCYSWMEAGWSEMAYIDLYLSRFGS